ncbi:MAG TPA: DALR domain-containing protein, partial [Ktedonobacterales bacterium]|nr:DALR domain-containing protein [Ktedonobacterales bacterium]
HEAGAGGGEPSERERRLIEQVATARAAFIEAMDDDLNTSGALGAIDELVTATNEYMSVLGDAPEAPGVAVALTEARAALDELTGVLGVSLEEAQIGLDAETRVAIEALVAQRAVARQSRDWAAADRIRQELDATYHVVVKDTPQGATWTVRE